MKAQEFRTLSDAELVKKLKELKAELFNLRFSNTTGSLANPKAIDACKKEIAKANTVIRERELGISKAPVEAPKAKKTESAKKVETKTTEKAESKPAAKKETKAAPKKQKVEKIMV